MSQPVVTVEISTDPPWDTTPTWVDISDRVTAITTRRQASLRQLGQVTAGTADVTVDNTDRAFDPAYTAGPLGTWAPGRRIRIRATHSSTTYGIFDGFIANLPQSYSIDSPRYQEITIPCIDGWADLSQQDLPDPLEAAIDALNPDFWWRLGTPGKIQPATTGGTEMVAGRLIPSKWILESGQNAGWWDQGLWGPMPWPRVSDFQDQNAGGPEMYARPTFTDGSTQSLSLWFSTTAPATTNQTRILWESGGLETLAYEPARLGIDDDGRLVYRNHNPSTSLSAIDGPLGPVVTDGKLHHVVVVQNGTTGVTVYLDGQVVASWGSTTAARLFLTGQVCRLGSRGDSAIYGGEDFQGTISDVAVWTSTALTAANVASVYEAGIGWDGDLSDDRLGRVLDAVGWPAAWRTFAVGKAVLGGQMIAGQAGELIRQIAASEGGLVFIDRDGYVRFRNRYWTSEETTAKTSQATFSDDGAGGAIDWRDGGFDWDVELWLLNNVTVAGVNNSWAKATDTTVPTRRHASVSTLLRTDDACSSLARKIVRHRRNALHVARPWAGRPQNTEWPTVLALELGDRVTFEVTPQGVGSQVAKEMTVSTIRHDIRSGGFDWTVSLEGDPIDPTSYFVLGTSTLNGTHVLG